MAEVIISIKKIPDSLSFDIVKSHGGELKVESKDGEGAEFVVLIPIV